MVRSVSVGSPSLYVVFEVSPEFTEGASRLTAQEHIATVEPGLALGAFDLRRAAAACEVLQQRRILIGDDDQHAAVESAGSPKPEVGLFRRREKGERAR